MMTAFEMQGRFSAISQISGMYIKVSNELIRPGITKVENLVVASNVDYPIQLKEFKKWCHESVQKIEGLAKDSNVVMAASVSNGIELLRQRVIEAAEDADR
jgi:hypothetical protein